MTAWRGGHIGNSAACRELGQEGTGTERYCHEMMHLEELRTRADRLTNTLVDLVNRDFESLVAMSSILVGTDDAVCCLGNSLDSFQQGVEQVQGESQGVLCSLQGLLVERASLDSTLSCLRFAAQIAEMISNADRIWPPLDFVGCERSSKNRVAVLRKLLGNLALIAKRTNFLFKSCQTAPRGWAFLDLTLAAVQLQQARLLQDLERAFCEAIRSADRVSILCALRIYSALHCGSLAEAYFARAIFRPVISGGLLRPRNLYDTVQRFMGGAEFSAVQWAASVVEMDRTATSFDFPVAVWSEVYDEVQQTIFRPASGSFHGDCISSMRFVESLEAACTSLPMLHRFRENGATRSWDSKWDRHSKTFMQLYKNVAIERAESVLDLGNVVASLGVGDETIYQAAAAVWQLIADCWRQHTILPTLGVNLKLTFQLIARYCAWLRTVTDSAGQKQPTFSNGDFETLTAIARVVTDAATLATKCEFVLALFESIFNRQ